MDADVGNVAEAQIEDILDVRGRLKGGSLLHHAPELHVAYAL